MGGGPCTWAARDHVRQGYPLWVTPDAARTFDDDPAQVAALGMVIVGEEEKPPAAAVPLTLGDLDYSTLAATFGRFGVDLSRGLDGIAVAVFDHGNAPPGMSDRLFRFEYIEQCVRRRNSLSTFAFPAEKTPAILTRMKATARAARAARPDLPIILMDTAPAAILGALQDPQVRRHRPAVIVNIGNFHCLACRLGPGAETEISGIEGIFEHHTGEVTPPQLENYVLRLAEGSLTHTEIFESNGHGAVLFEPSPIPLDFVTLTGPRRSLWRDSKLTFYQAAPFGDMMLAGCYGLARAYADVIPAWAEVITTALAGGTNKSLW